MDVALNKPATQSSVSMWSEGRTAEQDASRANSGFLADDYAFHTLPETDPWWQVDLGGLFRIHNVILLNRRTSSERLRHFAILTSVDGLDWETAYRNSDGSLLGPDSDSPILVGLEPQGKVARHVRIQVYGKLPLHFRDCQIMGEPIADDPALDSNVSTERLPEAGSDSPLADAKSSNLRPADVATASDGENRPASAQPDRRQSVLKQVFGWFGISG